MLKSLSGLLLLGLSLASCSAPDPGTGPIQADFGDEFPQEFLDVLLQDESLELVAIDPDWPTKESLADPTTLHGYSVRGRAVLDSRPLRQELLGSLGDAARENDGMVAACFNPRHALIAEAQGKTCEVIICFECLTFQIFDGEEYVETVDLSETPRRTFDRIFTDAGLSIAPRP